MIRHGRILTFLILTLVFTKSFSQVDSIYLHKYTGVKKDTAWSRNDSAYVPSAVNKSLDFKFGYGFFYKDYHALELGIKRTYFFGVDGHSRGFLGTHGFSLASDFLVKNKSLVMGPKIGYEIGWGFVGAKLNVIYYTSEFKKGDLKLRMEGGVTLLGYVTLLYGYSINLIDESVLPQVHSVSVSFNKPFFGHYKKRRVAEYTN